MSHHVLPKGSAKFLALTRFRYHRVRLGARADGVDWLETDVTSFESQHRFGLWYD